MWNDKTVSVILPTFNEKDSIRQCILNFQKTKVVDELIVVNNNAVAGTSEQIAGTFAVEVFEKRQGYGAAIMRGFEEATGDYILVCEPDGTFVENDIFKLLAYTSDYEIVFGSRTAKEFIWKGANMGFFLRWGNYAVAKMLEFLFNTNNLTDVGCTFRLLSRGALQRMRGYFKVYDNHFGPEMMLVACRLGLSFIQIPLNYKSRIGQSSVTGSLVRAVLLGLRMVCMILRHRMEGGIDAVPERVKTVRDLISSQYYYAFFAILTTLCLLRLQKPLGECLVGDASLFVVLVHKLLGLNDAAVVNLSTGQSIWHPLLYDGLLVLTGWLLGPDLVHLRMVGVACLVLNIVLIRKLCHQLSGSQEKGRMMTLIAVSLFVLIPYTLTGAVHIDIDNTLMTPVLLLFVLLTGRFFDHGRSRQLSHLWPLGLVLALGLWAKLTTPLIPVVAMGAVLLVRRRWKESVLYPGAIIIAGGTLFFLTWSLLCAALDYPTFTVFARIVRVFNEKRLQTQAAGIYLFLRDVGMIVFWLNPVMLVLWLLSLTGTLRDLACKKPVDDNVLLIHLIALLILLFYAGFGRITYGVPKYHYPCIALMAIGVAQRYYPLFLDMPLGRLKVALAVCGLLAMAYVFVDDPIRLLNCRLKTQILDGQPTTPLVGDLVRIAFFYLIPVVVGVILAVLSRPKAAVLALMAGILSQTSGFDICQSLANYQTTYAYGYQGLDMVCRRLPPEGLLLVAEGAVVPPRGIVGRREIHPDRSTIGGWLDAVNLQIPAGIVYGPMLNTITAMREIFQQPQWLSLIDAGYDRVGVGDLTLCLRRSGSR